MFRIGRLAVLAASIAALALTAAAPGSAAPASSPSVASATPGPSTPTSNSPLPLFAYYYQWFDPSSWNRAKIDYPALGRYSSDDTAIMRQHIREAKSVGIAGFIVSWKDTPTDTGRLKALAAVAAEEHFSLAMIYQGLDFDRKPLTKARVAADFKTFVTVFAKNPVFYRVGGKALTIWSGTWMFSHSAIAEVTGGVRASLKVLATEKSVGGYKRVADVVDGDAYYWSSVNPQTNPTYASKLDQLSAVIHGNGQYWLAPMAPGFDARLVGGGKTVDRADGATLRTEYATAVRSAPDALGLISWNEFSENTYVEPSQKYGRRYLDVLKDLTGTTVPTPVNGMDSSEALPSVKLGPNVTNAAIIVGFPLVLFVGVTVIARRRRRRMRRQTNPLPPRSEAPPTLIKR